MDLRVIFPKKGFPEDARKVSSYEVTRSSWSFQVKDLFEKTSLDEDQRKVRCKVLVNFIEVREMSLGELLSFREELKKSRNPRLIVQMSFDCSRLNNPSYREVAFKNKENLNKFLHLLYFVFRKIEIKLGSNSMKVLNQEDLNNEILNLEQNKKSFIEMEKTDFLKMYPVIKRLFSSYLKYLKNCFAKSVDIVEDVLPECTEELERWLLELNEWNPEDSENSEIDLILNNSKNRRNGLQRTIPKNPPNENIVLNNSRTKKKSESQKTTDSSVEIIILSPKNKKSESRKITPKGSSNRNIPTLCNLRKSKAKKSLEDSSVIILSPIETIEEWKRSFDPVLVIPSGSEEIAQKIRQTEKHSKIEVFEDSKTSESFIAIEYGRKVSFGLVDMSDAEEGRPSRNLSLLEIECPKECTRNSRKWICMKCGEFISYKEWTLHCSCGSKKYKEKLLVCTHPNHEREGTPDVELILHQLRRIMKRKSHRSIKK